MLLVLSVAFKLVGVFFLCIAAVGVIRLSDPFQRMHAATKAGTLGAGLVILGTVIAHGQMDATVLGLFTVVFLLLTVPVAGHLLGRASYVSGGRLSLRGEDALEGVLPRSSVPLDERLGWTREPGEVAELAPIDAPRPVRKTPVENKDAGAQAFLQPLQAIRFAAIDGHVDKVATRAAAIAATNGAELAAHVIVDVHAIEAAEDPAAMRRQIRERASQAIHALKQATERAGAKVIYHYDEGDPERLLAGEGGGETLLVLPCRGWFHHQVESPRSNTTWEPDGLLRLPAVHGGPVLYAAPDDAAAAAGLIVVCDQGEAHLPALVEWALRSNLWAAGQVVHVAGPGGNREEVFAAIATAFGCQFESRSVDTVDCAIPAELGAAAAVILGRTPRPLRTEWFGSHWRRRIATDMKGDVLLMEVPGTDPQQV